MDDQPPAAEKQLRLEVLRPDALLARAHRRRFAAVRAAHRFAGEVHAEFVMATRETAYSICAHAGLLASGAVGCASKGVHATTALMLPRLREAFPGYAYVCGGETPEGAALSSVARFDVASGAWEAAPPMRQRRSGATASVVAGGLYVCGGSDGDEMLSSVERFEPRRGAWEPARPMACARDGASSGVLSGRLYVCGGRASEHLQLSSVERFDPCARDWEGWGTLPLMAFQRVCLAVASLGGLLYACGGRDVQRLRSAERFDQQAECRVDAVALAGELNANSARDLAVSFPSVHPFRVWTGAARLYP
ncbi:unnamed protein product [Prorocentrum cordatum]|uniref:Uncharacterized protein n=1 Tax=Prorocentrum cordatum TaxID=2364126 RepID=A0ABN9W474_9DINO|nr:unnamed protein product [Polarella glacialis]